MKIVKLSVENFRTLENITLEFPSYYSAICGKNDAGKTNVIRTLSILFEERNRPFSVFLEAEGLYHSKNDFTKWIECENDEDRIIHIHSDIEVNKYQDTGLYEFILTYLDIKTDSDDIIMSIKLDYREERVKNVLVTINFVSYENLKAQEILKKLRSSNCFFNTTLLHSNFLLMLSEVLVGLLAASHQNIELSWMRLHLLSMKG